MPAAILRHNENGTKKKGCTNISLALFATSIMYMETLVAKKSVKHKTGVLYGMTILSMLLVANYSYSHCPAPPPSKPACQEPVALLFTAKRIDTKNNTVRKDQSRPENSCLSSCHFLTVPSSSGNAARTRSSTSSNASCFKQTGD